MASKIVDGRKVLVGSVADPTSARYDPTKAKNPVSPGTIPLNTISGPAPKPVNIPTPPPASAQAGLEGALTSQTDAFTRSLEQKTSNAASGKADAFDELMSALTGTEGSTALTDKAYSVKGGVDDLDPKLRQINADMVAEQEGLRTQLKDIEKNKTGLETSGLVAEQNRLKTESLDRQAALAVTQLSLQGQYDSAKAVADRAVAAKLEGQKQKIDLLEFIYSDIKDTWSTAEQREFETKQADRQSKLEMERQKEMARYNLILDKDLASYKAGLEADSPTSVTDVSALVAGGVPAPKANTDALTSLLQSKGLGQGTRTQVANVLGVINAAGDLANARLDGKFVGINPVRAVLDMKIPFTNIGLPFRNQVKSGQELENEGYVDAINLKVQQWASGASLTKEQIEQVRRFTPSVTDTDSATRTKLNNLSNFMLTQAKSQLQSEGIPFEPAKVNLFETMELLDQASPEQLEELRSAGLIQ